jgi:hypothetical protein
LKHCPSLGWVSVLEDLVCQRLAVLLAASSALAAALLRTTLTGILLLLATAPLALSGATLLLTALTGLLVLLIVAATLARLVTLVWICHFTNSVFSVGTIPEAATSDDRAWFRPPPSVAPLQCAVSND